MTKYTMEIFNKTSSLVKLFIYLISLKCPKAYHILFDLIDLKTNV